jgi:hypothetical protein
MDVQRWALQNNRTQTVEIEKATLCNNRGIFKITHP